MTAPNPRCPICQGRGWFETGLFELEDDPQPCPDCNPVRPLRRSDFLLICTLIAMMFGLAVWGGR